MRIHVMFTGGTIGSAVGADSVIAPRPEAAGKELLRRFFEDSPSTRKEEVEFVTSEPYSCLSEDVTPATWNKLIKALQDLDFSEYDGVIITHGTDTMALTANLLSVALAGIGTPVVLVGSNQVLSNPAANGVRNFSHGVDLIADGRYTGVYVIFNGRVHLGSRVLQCAPFTDDYESVAGVHFADMVDGVVVPVESSLNPTKDQIAQLGTKMTLLYSLPALTGSVLWIVPHAGLNYDRFLLNEEVKAVLHGLYHSSTACVGENPEEESPYSILTFARRCHAAGIPLYIAPYDKRLTGDAGMYTSTAEMQKLGVQTVFDQSEQMAYVKLLLATALAEGDCARCLRFLNDDFFFERVARL